MKEDKITIDVQITPKKSLEYVTLNFTMDKWSDMFSLNKNRQKKIKSILNKFDGI
jgi:hypothetical protein